MGKPWETNKNIAESRNPIFWTLGAIPVLNLVPATLRVHDSLSTASDLQSISMIVGRDFFYSSRGHLDLLTIGR